MTGKLPILTPPLANLGAGTFSLLPEAPSYQRECRVGLFAPTWRNFFPLSRQLIGTMKHGAHY